VRSENWKVRQAQAFSFHFELSTFNFSSLIPNCGCPLTGSRFLVGLTLRP
jgi:hypothetical protein